MANLEQPATETHTGKSDQATKQQKREQDDARRPMVVCMDVDCDCLDDDSVRDCIGGGVCDAPVCPSNRVDHATSGGGVCYHPRDDEDRASEQAQPSHDRSSGNGCICTTDPHCE